MAERRGMLKRKRGCSRSHFENSFKHQLKSKRSMELEMLGWIILGVVVLIIVIISIIVLKDKGISAIDYIKTLFRFGK